MSNVKRVNLLHFILVFLMFIRFISSFPLDNSRLPGGVDTPCHLFKVWHIAEKDNNVWTHDWYGGMPFLRFYPPLSLVLPGYIGKIIGYLLAYKLVIDLFYVLTPLAFYYFLNQFKLSEKTV